MVNVVNGLIHVVGYVPVVGSVVGGSRMALSGIVGAINFFACVVFVLVGDVREAKQYIGNIILCAQHFFTGVVEFVPFAKIAVKVIEIFSQTQHCWSPGIFQT